MHGGEHALAVELDRGWDWLGRRIEIDERDELTDRLREDAAQIERCGWFAERSELAEPPPGPEDLVAEPFGALHDLVVGEVADRSTFSAMLAHQPLATLVAALDQLIGMDEPALPVIRKRRQVLE